MAQLAQHHDDLRPVLLAQSFDQRIAHLVSREILVLDVDRSARSTNSCRDTALRLRARRPSRSQQARCARWRSQRPSDPPRASQANPRSTFRCARRIVRACRLPVRSRDRSLCASVRARDRRAPWRRIAIDRHHEIVKRRIGRTLRHASRVVGRMRRCVPAPTRQVDPAVEGNAIVDHDDLLMVRAADRMRVVMLKVHAMVRLPAKAMQRSPLAVQPEDHRVVPDPACGYEARGGDARDRSGNGRAPALRTPSASHSKRVRL